MLQNIIIIIGFSIMVIPIFIIILIKSCIEGCTSPQACGSLYVAKFGHQNNYQHHGHPHPQVPKDAHLLRFVGAHVLQSRGVHQRCVHTGLHLVFVFYLYLLAPGQQDGEGDLDDENRNNDGLMRACTWSMII